MIADEAHRTAGLRRNPKLEQKIRDFTVCHDESKFPVKYRVYQTATPKVFGTNKPSNTSAQWIVKSMDDEDTFGVELFRKSYIDALKNNWLSDYRIIALGVNDLESYEIANRMAAQSDKKLSVPAALRGLALALVMGGMLRHKGVVVESSINFVNTIQHSKAMKKLLESEEVRNWVKDRVNAEAEKNLDVQYELEHLDANDKVSSRDAAKAKLASASESKPYGIINVGIFGEGVDAPSLSAVGFLEPRKSPVDVIQSVGRVMRLSPNKTLGYIICPITIGLGEDAETLLRDKPPEHGWKELGQILVALRAHDRRIEDELRDFMDIYVPPAPETVRTVTTIGHGTEVEHCFHDGTPNSVLKDVRSKLNDSAELRGKFSKLDKINSSTGPAPGRIVSGKKNVDGSIEMRSGPVQYEKLKRGETVAKVHINKTKKTGVEMLNGKKGRKIATTKKTPPKPKENRFLIDLFEHADSAGITVNLLTKSGLLQNRSDRDVNILQNSIDFSTRHLQEDGLGEVLDKHFGYNYLSDEKRKKQADGCTTASLVLMNACLLHQRIAAGKWLPRISGMDTIKNSVDTAVKLSDQWNDITRHDFLPIIVPALEIIRVVRDSGILDGLNRALRHLASEAEFIAESYADLGSDHAGALFNKVMGNQASDGAYFSRPPMAALVAKLTLDVYEEYMDSVDWSLDETWRDCRTADLACGSGTLLAGVLTEMKRRAALQGADQKRLGELQKLAVEEIITGLDFHPVSLQMAGAQLIAGNRSVNYKSTGLHRMDYGPKEHGGVAVGSLELLGHSAIIPRREELDLDYEHSIKSDRIQLSESEESLLDDPVKAVKGARLVVMNPPFTNRNKMGEKFSHEDQKRLRERVDGLEVNLLKYDSEMEGFIDKTSINPLFVALADKCLNASQGTLSLINPTIMTTASSAENLRKLLADRFHIHTIVTSHDPRQINMSQDTSINESIIIMRRYSGTKPPTRIISLDRMPLDEADVANLHQNLFGCSKGLIPNGWGEVSEWATGLIEQGDWSAAVWRSPCLAMEASSLANMENLPTLNDQNMIPSDSGRILYGAFKVSPPDIRGCFPVLKSKGMDAQTTIKATPDSHWVPKKDEEKGLFSSKQDIHPETDKILQKAGYLLITAGQRIDSGRLVAVASNQKYIGTGWTPISNVTPDQAKAAAVFLNSTAGRLQIMRLPSKSIGFAHYKVKQVKGIRLPDLGDSRIVKKLVGCWERTANMTVPQFREGECEVRQLWDEAVADALNWDHKNLSELRHLLHKEPFVRGFGYNQYGNEEK